MVKSLVVIIYCILQNDLLTYCNRSLKIGLINISFCTLCSLKFLQNAIFYKHKSMTMGVDLGE